MKKKIMATLLTVAMCVVMVGCGSSVDPNASRLETAPPAPESNEPSVVVDPPSEETELVEEIEDANAVEFETDASGLIMVQVSWNGLSLLSYTVYAVNPETGTSHKLNQFSFANVTKFDSDINIQPPISYSRFANLHDYFSSDYTKIAATKSIIGTNEEHAGWVDAAGNFFDVTEALGEQAQSDFDTPAKYRAVGFQDDIFIYVYHDGKQFDQYYGVAVDNITPGASWEIDSVDKMIREDYDAWHWLNHYDLTDWLDDDHALVENQQEKCRIATISTQTLEEYLPGEDTHHNWSAVSSPDGSQVAFMSQPNGGTDISIHIASISGENPVRIEPDFMSGIQDSLVALPTSGATYCYILEWR